MLSTAQNELDWIGFSISEVTFLSPTKRVGQFFKT